MNKQLASRWQAATVGLLTIAVATSTLCGAPPGQTLRRGAGPECTVLDVQLDPHRRLVGVATDALGRPASRTKVVVARPGRASFASQTDANGWFAVPLPAGGIYVVLAGPHRSAVVRAWVQGTAPMKAESVVVLAEEGTTVIRGQRVVGDFFGSNWFLGAAWVTAAVAIPIAVHSNRVDESTGS